MKYFKGRWNLYLASLMILMVSLFQWKRWGINILQELDDGNFFFLGGPSLWYPTALFPTIVGIGYLITFLFSMGTVEIKTIGGTVFFSEKKANCLKQVTLTKTSILSIKITNTRLRMSAVGVLVLILSSYYLAIDGISLLTYSAVYGYGVDTGIYYLFQAISNLIASGLVLFYPPGEIRIRSSEVDRVIIELPPRVSNNSIRELFQIFDILDKKEVDEIKTYTLGITYGIILILSSIMSRIFFIFSNEILRIIYIFIGLWFLLEGLKRISSKKRNGWWYSIENPFTETKKPFWFYLLWSPIILVTLISITNSLMLVTTSINQIKFTVGIIVFIFIMVFPAIWLVIEHRIGKTVSKDFRIL